MCGLAAWPGAISPYIIDDTGEPLYITSDVLEPDLDMLARVAQWRAANDEGTEEHKETEPGN